MYFSDVCLKMKRKAVLTISILDTRDLFILHDCIVPALSLAGLIQPKGSGTETQILWDPATVIKLCSIPTSDCSIMWINHLISTEV